jgi:endoglycosylceramidase
VIAAIRTVDPNGLVWFEPNVIFNDGADTNLGDPGDRHVGFAFHDYCLVGGALFGGGDPGPGQECDSFDDLVFANAEKYSRRTGAALLMTEFGATTDTKVLTKMADRSDLSMVGWQEWHYCGCDDPTTAGPGDTQALVRDPRKPPTGANLDTNKLGALSRPYPQAVAGTPKAFGFDARSKTFNLRYATVRAGGGTLARDAQTEIAVPERQYPNGYAVDVHGGHIRSQPGDRIVRVVKCTTAVEISVKITPGSGQSDTCAAPTASPPPGAGKLPLRLSVSPKKAVVGRVTRFRFGVKRGKTPIAGAKVRLGRARALTNSRGRATMRIRFHRARRISVRVSARGYRSAQATVRVRRR